MWSIITFITRNCSSTQTMHPCIWGPRNVILRAWQPTANTLDKLPKRCACTQQQTVTAKRCTTLLRNNRRITIRTRCEMKSVGNLLTLYLAPNDNRRNVSELEATGEGEVVPYMKSLSRHSRRTEENHESISRCPDLVSKRAFSNTNQKCYRLS
jgi:hypothetical protein